ncbi:MAG TPA: carboxymuconolactone decarboxylase family protein [Longimicrobiales bacterium]|nr:carboxymuconolactone decarboxylase family protein [Longimicrobiales bacterium]
MIEQSTRALIAMCAAVGARNRAALSITIDTANEQADPAEAEEALLQSYLFVGYPVALQALSMWRERTGREAEAKASTDKPAEWKKRGEEVCEVVYGGQYGKLRENIARLHPDMERWMLEEGYGKVLSRPGLDLKTRELCIIGVLVGLDAPQQLYSHLRGALNAGAPQEDVETAVEIACAHTSLAAKDSARKVWKDLREKRVR